MPGPKPACGESSGRLLLRQLARGLQTCRSILPAARRDLSLSARARTWYVLSNLSYMNLVMIEVLPTL
jgi:hypothetical protein